MKRFERFIFQTDHHTAAECVSWLDSLGISPFESEVVADRGSRGDLFCWVDVRLPVGDQRPSDLLHAMSSSVRASLTHREEIDYSRADYLGAVACEVAVAQSLKIQTGSIYGTQYDWTNACPECGIGRVQVGPLMAKRSQLPKGRQMVKSEYLDVLISKRLRDDLVEKIPEVARCLRDVVDTKSSSVMDYWQLIPEQVMPPRDLSSKGVITDDTAGTDRCKTCRRNGYFGDGVKAFEPRYRLSNDEIARLAPLTQSWEHWSFSHIKVPYVKAPVVAEPSIIARRDVVKVLLDAKVREVRLTPIQLV